MKERALRNIRIRLRVREVAETRGIDLAGLVLATGLPRSTVEELWEHPTRDQTIETMVTVARALDATLGELVEILDSDSSGGVQPGPVRQQVTGEDLDKRKEKL